ncbi:MAG: metallophosphoesterase [Campylobacterota bacterium]|nr:metallophosphoesterase [Campylobacterota bacterium]
MKSTLFFSLFFILFFSIHVLFYLRVIRKLLVSDSIKRIFALLISLNFLFNILYVVGRYSDIITSKIYFLFSISIGVTFVLILYLFIHEAIHLFHKTLKSVDPSKRKFIKQSGDGMLMALSTAYITTGVYEGSKKPVINVVEMGLFDFSIVQISDLHIGGLIDREFVRHSVEKINSLKADIVIITGDLIDTDIYSIERAVLELNAIKSKHGIYYILGNHEYFHHPEDIIEFVQKRTKLTLLLNDSITIDALSINIVGVTDLFGYRADLLEPDINRAYSGVNPNYKTILLAHQPKFIQYLGEYRPDLILCGHTHGGQIWPFAHLVKLQQPYVKGLHTLPNGSMIYINSGIGFWGPPMRLGSQAEIAYLV